MPAFDVTIDVTVGILVSVEADNEEAAENLAEQAGDEVLDTIDIPSASQVGIPAVVDVMWDSPGGVYVLTVDEV